MSVESPKVYSIKGLGRGGHVLVPLPVGLVGAVRLQVWSSGRPALGHSVGAKVSLPQLGVQRRRRLGPRAHGSLSFRGGKFGP